MRLRFAVWSLGSLSILIITIGIVVITTQAKSAGVCLRYDTRDDQRNGDVRTIDPVSGMQMVVSKPPPLTNSRAGDLSPDNKHMIYLVGPKNGPYSLYVDSHPYKKRPDGYIYCVSKTDSCWYDVKPYSNQARVLTSGIISGEAPAMWLDNERLLYTRFTGNKKTLVLGRIDGTVLHTLPIAFDAQVGFDVGFYDYDETHLVFTATTMAGTTYIYKWSFNDNQIQEFSSPLLKRDLQITFSPKEHYISVIPDRSQPSQMLVFDTETKSAVQLTLPKSTDLFTVTWSPDEKYMMLYPGSCCIAPYIAIVDMQGHIFTAGKPTANSNFWLPDSSAYIFLEDRGSKSALIAFRVDTGKTETLSDNVHQLYGVLKNGHLVVIWRESDQWAAGLVDPRTAQKIVLTTGNQQVYAELLPDNQSALIFAEENEKTITAYRADQEGRTTVFLDHLASLVYTLVGEQHPKLIYSADHNGKVSLESINLDGTERKVLIEGMEAVEDMGFFTKNGEIFRSYTNSPLYYILLKSQRNGLQTIELLNYQTDSHHVLTQGHSFIDLPTMDYSLDGLLHIDWEDNNRIGVDGYSIDGKLVYHLMPSPSSVSLGTRGRIAPLSVSPDTHVVAVIPDRDSKSDASPLALMASDSSWTVMLSEDVGKYSLNWSPDGKMLAYLQTVTQGADTTFSIHIVTERGDPILKVDNFDRFGSLEWIPCR